MNSLQKTIGFLMVSLAASVAWGFQVPSSLPPDIIVPSARESNASLRPDANATHPAKPLRSSKLQTIEQAGRDLHHVDEGVRLGAAKLLGKYPSPATAAHLAMALDDRIARVRRAAIHAVSAGW